MSNSSFDLRACVLIFWINYQKCFQWPAVTDFSSCTIIAQRLHRLTKCISNTAWVVMGLSGAGVLNSTPYPSTRHMKHTWKDEHWTVCSIIYWIRLSGHSHSSDLWSHDSTALFLNSAINGRGELHNEKPRTATNHKWKHLIGRSIDDLNSLITAEGNQGEY